MVLSLDEWEAQLAAKRGGEGIKSARMYRTALETMLRKLGITTDQLAYAPDAYLSSFLSARGKRGFNRYLKAVRSYCDANGGKKVKTTPLARQSDYSHVRLSDAEIERIDGILAAAGMDDARAIFLFGIETGSRPSAILEWSKNPTFYTENGLQKTEVWEEKQRKRVVKILSMRAELLEILRVGKFPRKWDVKVVEDQLRDAYLAAGLKERFFYLRPLHALRHVSAFLWLRRTHNDISTVAKLIGDEERTVRSYYAAILDEDVDAIVKGIM